MIAAASKTFSHASARHKCPDGFISWGGTAIVYRGLRGRTLGIDIAVDSDETRLLEAVRRLKDELQVNVELASPADFIPLPSDWENRAQFIGRFGTLDVFYFDFDSIALTKIVRANERDLDDLVLLAREGLVHLQALEQEVAAMLPQLGSGRYFNVDPAAVAHNFAAVRQRIADAEQR
ncbi:MAG TPA: DUF6036 family nucleotidyltransferase [Ktedonobacterales bacterium]